MPNVSPLRYASAMTIRVDAEFREAVDDIRSAMKPVPTMSEAIRVAVLEYAERQKKKRGRPNGR